MCLPWVTQSKPVSLAFCLPGLQRVTDGERGLSHTAQKSPGPGLLGGFLELDASRGHRVRSSQGLQGLDSRGDL